MRVLGYKGVDSRVDKMVSESIIRLVNIHKSFGSQRVLKGISLDIDRARITTIIGGSGSGKSVLVKHMIGLLKADEGQVFFEDEDLMPMGPKDLARIRRNFGMLFQHSALFDSMSVEENVAFPLVEHTRLSRRKIRDLVLEKLALLGLEGMERKFPAELSGGMRKRVGLARALVLNPKVIIYDEPTTGLDPLMTLNVDQMIRETQEQFKVTSVVISHDMASTFRISDRIAMLYQGNIVEYGSPADLSTSRNEYVRRFFAAATSLDEHARGGGRV